MDAPKQRHRGPAAGEVPNEREAAQAFPRGDQRPLREQRDLHDEDGTDIREYTGEPVETEFGTVLPQQMNVGAERVVGHGEFPNTRHDGASNDEDPAEADGYDARLWDVGAVPDDDDDG